MKHFGKYIFIITIFLLTVGILIYKLPKVEAPTQHVLSTTTTVATDSAHAVTSSKCHARYLEQNDPQAVLPDASCTPGAVNANVTQNNIYETICKSGYTKTIRPPVSYTNKLKIEQISDYGFSDTSLKDYEEDHLISLELGGDPNSALNLWPEPHGSPNEKDAVENYLNDQICHHNMQLEEAQKAISSNWYEIYQQINH